MKANLKMTIIINSILNIDKEGEKLLKVAIKENKVVMTKEEKEDFKADIADSLGIQTKDIKIENESLEIIE